MTSTRRALRLGFLSFSLVAASALGTVAGCGSDDDDTGPTSGGTGTGTGTGTGSDGGTTPTSDGALDDAAVDTTPVSLITANTTDISLYSGAGGLLPSEPDGSACDVPSETYTLTFSTQVFTYRICATNDGGPYALQTGSSTVSAADFATFSADLAAMMTSPATACGADEGADTIAVSDADGTVTYSSCGGMTATGFAASLTEAASLVP